MTPRFTDPGPKYPAPSFDSPSDFMGRVKRSDRRQQSRPVAVERRQAMRRRDDIAAVGR